MTDQIVTKAEIGRRGMLLGGAALTAALALPWSDALAAEPAGVVTSIAQLADAVREIAPDPLAENALVVESLMGEGVDPHTYRLTRSDTVKLARADLVLAVGLYLEAGLADTLHSLESRTRVALVGEGLPDDRLLAAEGQDGSDPEKAWDPHIWMDPGLWSEAVALVAGELTELRPAQAPAIAEGLAAYRARLASLDDYARLAVGSIPESNRVLVSAHDAFRYFGRAYGVEVVGIQGISTESEAGLRRIEALVDLLVDRRVGAIFVESSVSDRQVRALIEGAAARGHAVEIGGQLFSDAMGPPGTYEGTYVGMLDHNITTIVRALGGTAPALGLNGRLTAAG